MGLDNYKHLKATLKKEYIAKMEIDIKALESAIADAINHPSELLGVCLTVKEAQAVLALLKEQEPVSSKELKAHYGEVYKCNGCGLEWYQQTQRYCQHCGKAVKWD